MKIADSDSIKAGEQELIASIMEKMNPETLARVAGKTLVPDRMEFVRGDMVIRGDRIVYQMDFKVTLDVTVMFDRNGELIGGVTDDTPVLDDELSGPEPAADQEDLLAESFPALETENETPDSDVPADDGAPPSMEEDLEDVLARTRDFWQRKRDDAPGGRE
ncbi:hypothetical protein JCM14469_11070 [Desulfatiferula olefinivorans]